jgi:hypothetical protein
MDEARERVEAIKGKAKYANRREKAKLEAKRREEVP